MNGMKARTATLEAADPFDPVFLRMMVAHHRDAIEIANRQLAKGQDRELRALARQIIRAQRRELGQMRRQLAIRAVRRTRPTRPPGPRDPRSGSPTCPALTTTAACPASPSDCNSQPDATVQDRETGVGRPVS